MFVTVTVTVISSDLALSTTIVSASLLSVTIEQWFVRWTLTQATQVCIMR